MISLYLLIFLGGYFLGQHNSKDTIPDTPEKRQPPYPHVLRIPDTRRD